MNEVAELTPTQAAVQVRDGAAFLARSLPNTDGRLEKSVDPREWSWIHGKLSDDAFVAKANPEEVTPWDERRRLALLIVKCSDTPDRKPNELNWGLILATINGTQSVADLQAHVESM